MRALLYAKLLKKTETAETKVFVVALFSLVAFRLRGARALWINIVGNYCCMRVLLYAKLLKETETEETIFFVILFSLVAFQLGGPGPLGPPWLLLCGNSKIGMRVGVYQDF